MQGYQVFWQQADRRVLIYSGNRHGRTDLTYALEVPVRRPNSFGPSIPTEFMQCGDHR